MATKAYATLGAVVTATVGGIAFVHWRQKAERARMHKGVLRDIAKEEEEARQRDLAAALSLAASSTPAPSSRVCEGDICDLSQTRFRDPVTGQVYVPAGQQQLGGMPSAAAAT